MALFSCSKPENDTEINANIGTFTFGEGEGYTISDDRINITTQYRVKENKLVEVTYTDAGKVETLLNAAKTSTGIQLKKTPIPEFLLEQEQNRMVFGCNACANLKNFYVHVEIDGDKYYWSFDQNMETLPVELQDYVKQVKETINAIK
ncbi:hypothetical protein C4F40_13145 [Sphingobacterium sp. Ka21]|uniref:Uncharacterized protein n=2 Tax=Sphingobacterium pedocola TaxID=2082722 RepID=A0ABR9T8I9_9SPHI|nr:hypothetical protein [Sphingobacterium pedocola]